VSATHHGLIGLYENHDAYIAVGRALLAAHEWQIGGVVALPVSGYAARLGWKVKHHRHHKQRRGLGAQVGPLAGWEGPVPPKAIKWPLHPEATGAVVTIHYPEGWPAFERKTRPIKELIEQRAGGTWQAAHDHGRSTLRWVRQAPPAVMPDRVAYEYDPAADVAMIPFAVDAAGRWLTADLADLTPHVLISASTGWGKSSTARVFVGHVAGHGGLVDILDPKRVSLAEFKGLPNVRYVTEPEAFAPKIAAFLDEIEQRYRAMEAGENVQDRERFPLRLLVLEEMGTMMGMIADEWSDQRPPTPPTHGKLHRILWMGRACGMHVLAAAQQANARVLTGSDARDQYALKICPGPQSASAWSMMFGDESMVPSEPHKGRAVVGIGPRIARAQLAYLAPGAARRIAERGLSSFGPTGGVVADVQLGETAGQSVAADVQLPRPDVQPNVQLDVQLEPVELVCRCGHVWETRSPEKGKCSECGVWKRVPVGART
jgi:hypothetical protein